MVDDDPKIVRLVRTYLERDGLVVTTAGDGAVALVAIERDRPALVVLDLMLPELDGRAVIRAVRRNADTEAIPILVLSARGTTVDRIGGLDDGADDYLPKPFSPSELVLRVKAILRRTKPPGEVATARAATSTDSLLTHDDLVVDIDRHEVRIGSELVPLTLVEFRLLAALLNARGRVLTRDRLLDAAYGENEMGVLDRTIDVHIGRLRNKLGDRADQARYVATVRGVGYRAAPALPRPAAAGTER